MLYPVVLFIHSWLRWVVLLAALWSLVASARARSQKREWNVQDERRGRLFVGLVDAQFTLGFLLYVWLSPIVRGAFADMGVAMRSAPLRFFAVEHITAMFIAVACVHIAQVRARRKEQPTERHGVILKGSAAFLLFALVGIPWPGLKQARPLARTSVFEASPAPRAELDLFSRRCASCHGASGRGDGLAATAMDPRPRNLSDAQWQSSVSDADITQAIREGGLARNLSPSMPPHPDLSPAQLAELVTFIRGLRAEPPSQ
ncbi:MAG: cytochrome c [Myxococcales bacterium]